MHRISGLAFAFAFALVFVSAASADIALPKDQQQVDPKFCFEGTEKQGDTVFFLRYLTFVGSPSGVPHRLLEIKDDKAFPLGAQRRLSSLQVLALNRKEFEKRSKEDSSLKWLSDKTEGVLMVEIATPNVVFPVSQKEIPVNTYRLSIKDGKVIAEKLADKPGVKQGDATPFNPVPLWLFGILGAASVMWFGVWFARRK